jgi:CubicO group peptidase (beta-lactamase class C family)
MPRAKAILLSLLIIAIGGSASAAPDEEELGKSNGYPSIKYGQWPTDYNKIGSMTNMYNVYKSAVVHTGGDVRKLKQHPMPPSLKFFANGHAKMVDDLLDMERVTGLLILKDSQIVVERYQYDRQPEMKFLSYSMAKTITGILVGAALKDGYIKSLDDTAGQYVADLRNSDYGNITIRNLLRMGSGMKWVEHGAETGDDVGNLVYQTVKQGGSGGVSAISSRKRSNVPQGTEFNYNSADTFVLGLVLSAATGRSVADYTSEKIWSKIGAEDDAYWNVDWKGNAVNFAFFNARLRDYGCLALFISEGMKDIVSEEYLMEMTDVTRQPDHSKARAIYKYWGYGYQTWLLPYKTRTFAMLGSYGQLILMQPDTKICVVMTRAWKFQRSELKQFQFDIALVHGMLRSLGGNLEQYPIPH